MCQTLIVPLFLGSIQDSNPGTKRYIREAKLDLTLSQQLYHLLGVLSGRNAPHFVRAVWLFAISSSRSPFADITELNVFFRKSFGDLPLWATLKIYEDMTKKVIYRCGNKKQQTLLWNHLWILLFKHSHF